ncbi:LamG-like jellyroll fold domain-containing protein, partial [Planctomycetota bacterium]
IWVNGVKGATVLAAPPQIDDDSAYGHFLGVYNGGDTRYWDGLIDNLMVFNKTLTADEIAFLYNGGNGIEALS